MPCVHAGNNRARNWNGWQEAVSSPGKAIRPCLNVTEVQRQELKPETSVRLAEETDFDIWFKSAPKRFLALQDLLATSCLAVSKAQSGMEEERVHSCCGRKAEQRKLIVPRT